MGVVPVLPELLEAVGTGVNPPWLGGAIANNGSGAGAFDAVVLEVLVGCKVGVGVAIEIAGFAVVG